MGRRKKSSAAEDFAELVALMPWWVGVLLAVLSYAVLHSSAARPLDPVVPGQTGSMMVGVMIRSLSMVGQYVVPLLCLFGAAISAYRRKKRRSLVQQVAEVRTAAPFSGLSWSEFELMVGEGFRRQGYQVVETGGGGPDGGVDLLLKRDRETFLVQCKQWRAQKVGVQTVRELYGVMAAKGAAGGFVVTSGSFSEEAQQFAKGRNVQLLDGIQLKALVDRVSAAPAPQAGIMQKSSSTPPRHEPKGAAQDTAPTCPKCSAPMLPRRAIRGANAGSSFLGCSQYPSCRGTRPMDGTAGQGAR